MDIQGLSRFNIKMYKAVVSKKGTESFLKDQATEK